MATVLLVEDDPAARQGLELALRRFGYGVRPAGTGVAAIVAVLGLSASSSAGLLAEIARLGTNLLTVQNGQTLTGGTAELPPAFHPPRPSGPCSGRGQEDARTSSRTWRRRSAWSRWNTRGGRILSTFPAGPVALSRMPRSRMASVRR